jgi:hypothetical protein
MDEIVKADRGWDKAAIEIGIFFIEEDDYFPFGRILKSEYCSPIAPRVIDTGATN